MDIFSQKIERSELKVGDHIYTWRKQVYSHHGIFIGEDKVINFVNPKRGSFRFSVGSSSSVGDKKLIPCPKPKYCGLEKVTGSGVRVSCIDCFIKNGSLYRFKYQASHGFLLFKLRGGTCTTARSDPPEEVIHRANYLYENGYEEYDLMNNNCEDFALYCKTGLWSTNKNYQGRSSQANMVHPTSSTYLQDGIDEIVQRLLTAIPRSFSKRENKDLGIRDDVEKVPVEKLSSYLFKVSMG